ncbi:MAG TPA: hypothetical protein VFB59_01275 [Candidatus Saccharimonadales bacterium]|nr:hypothetical protein [Candidatus Saccharimonadales bacterium]
MSQTEYAGVDYFGTYIPTVQEADAIFAATNTRIPRLATAIEEEFGTGGNPLLHNLYFYGMIFILWNTIFLVLLHRKSFRGLLFPVLQTGYEPG